MDNKEQENQENQPQQQETKKPDDVGGIHVQAHVKIFDPETQEVYLIGRA